MAQVWALMWDIKPGSEEAVEAIFKNSGRPEHVIRDEDGNQKGMLLGTYVLMKDTTVVRVIEFEGEFMDVAVHMRKQQEVVDLEAQLDEHLLEPRDMSTPEGARDFFMKTAMRPILARRHDDEGG